MKSFSIVIAAKILLRLSHYYWNIIYSAYRYRYELNEHFRFNGKFIQMYGDGRIVAGEKSYVGDMSTLQAAKGYVIKIGNNCRISHNVRVYTQSDCADFDFSLSEIPSRFGNVIFGDCCWVGANVFINPGITIGANSIVGANSVVTKDIPPFEIWGGVPAKFIRSKKIS